MILCVTLNPCLDRTLTVPDWHPGENVRGTALREVVGGKGNNVARALSRLGRAARPATFLGGSVGTVCEELLRRDDGLDPLIVQTEAPTRTILTVRTGDGPRQTAFFDPDPAITAAEADEFSRRIEATLAEGDVAVLTLSGSSPSPATHALYSDLIALARSRRIPVFLDTYGPALRSIWGFWPDVIQLNRREAGQHLSLAAPSDGAVVGLLRSWHRHGVSLAVITDGHRPILALAGGEILRLDPPPIHPVNPIGSGDCFLAGMVDAWLSERPPADILRHGAACAVANALVWDAGAIDPAEVERWEREMVVQAGDGLA
jgi:1-phosphofructokinase family hexose kinase